MTPDELPDDPEIDALLAALDEPPPPVSVESLLARGRTPAGAPRRHLRWAAGIALALGVAGAAYAAPGSPLPGWLGRIGESIDRGANGRPSAVVPVPASAGVAVDVGGPVVIRFAGRLAGYARVSLTDDSEVVTRSADGSTRFSSEPDQLLIEHPSFDTLQVSVPRTAPRVEVVVGARTVWLKQGPEVVTSAAAGDFGDWLVPLAESR